MIYIPPLGVVAGAILPPEVFGGFGPVDAFTWRGACVGGCGARPGCRAEEPAPECSGCGRARRGLTDVAPRVPWRPAVHALGADWQPTAPLVSDSPSSSPSTPSILRPATDVRPDDPALPAGVRRLVAIAPAGTRVTLAVAVDADGAPVASLAVRVPGVGYAVYTRGESGAWRFSTAAVLAPRPRHRLPARLHLQRANVGRFTAALLGQEYDAMPALDVAPPAPVPTGVCPGCGAEVRLTQAGAIYANHRCKSKTIEGRS